MSNKETKLDSDGFQIVSKRSSKKLSKLPTRETNFLKEEIEIDIDKSYRKILSAVEDLKLSEYLKTARKAVSNSLQQRKLVEIVCFGLGHIGECKTSQYQLALLLCLKDFLNPAKVLVHDPIFYANECELLKRLHLDVISQNQEGNYIIPNQDATLVYLPHCPKQLTNNFLWSNWSLTLSNCILLCNSFTSLIENQPSRTICKSAHFISLIFPHTTEITLENNFVYKDIFNDISIHYFEKVKLDLLSPDFWLNKEKPHYENSEEFITTLMVEKLNI